MIEILPDLPLSPFIGVGLGASSRDGPGPAAAETCRGVVGGNRLGRPPAGLRIGDSGLLKLGLPPIGLPRLPPRVRGPGESDRRAELAVRAEWLDNGGVGGALEDDAESRFVALEMGTNIPDIGDEVAKYRTLRAEEKRQ